MIDPSLFIPSTVESREIELADKTKHTLFFRHLGVQAWERFAMQSHSHDEEVASLAAARLLAEGLCDEAGKPALKLEDVLRLKRSVFRRMFSALLEVNSYTAAGADRVEDEAGKA